MPLLRKILILMLILAGTTAAFTFFVFQRQAFSDADFRVEIIAPEEADAGEEIEYLVRYRNNSDIRLENVRLVFKYPEAAFPINGEDLREDIDLSNINPGEERTITFRAVLLGKEREVARADALISYTPQNLTATYQVEREHATLIREVPLSFEIDIPNEIEAEEEFSFIIRYFSNMDYLLENVAIRAEYPSGFKFIRSTPRALEEKEWSRGFLEGNEGGIIEVFGEMEGSPGDMKGFSAELGVWKRDNFIPLKEASARTLIPEPALFVDVQVNGSSDYVASPGEDLYYEIYFRNIGDKILRDLFLIAELDKDLINLDEVEPMRGRLQRDAGTIIWSHSFVSALRSISPGEEEKISFWARVKDQDLPQNPEIKMLFDIEKARKDFRTKVNTQINLVQEIVEDEEIFENESSFPFRINEENIYVVSWKIENLYNDVSDLKVEASLPQGASIEETDGDDDDFSFNSDTGEIIWEVDEVERGAGISRSAPRVYFKVSLTPTSPLEDDFELVSEVEVSGRDLWTTEKLEETFSPILYHQVNQ